MSEKSEGKRRSASGRLSYFYLPTIILVALVLLINIGVKNQVQGVVSGIWLDQIFARVVDYSALFCEVAAVIVILAGTVKTLFRYFRPSRDNSLVGQIHKSEALRLSLGPQLSLSLEFAMASDILRITRSPSFSEIIILLAIVLLRVLLNYFLDLEEDMISEKEDLPELNKLDSETKED